MSADLPDADREKLAVAMAALGRLFDQAWNTAGDSAGRGRVREDGAHVTSVLADIDRIRDAAAQAARAEAWDEGWWKGQNDHDPTLMGYALNPYRDPTP